MIIGEMTKNKAARVLKTMTQRLKCFTLAQQAALALAIDELANGESIYSPEEILTEATEKFNKDNRTLKNVSINSYYLKDDKDIVRNEDSWLVSISRCNLDTGECMTITRRLYETDITDSGHVYDKLRNMELKIDRALADDDDASYICRTINKMCEHFAPDVIIHARYVSDEEFQLRGEHVLKHISSLVPVYVIDVTTGLHKSTDEILAELIDAMYDMIEDFDLRER